MTRGEFVAATRPPRNLGLRISVRAIILLSAMLLLVFGFAILTRPLFIPITVTLWLCAAALTGYAVVARLPED
jgi:type IV secretory pathway VirB3-like protein